MKRCRSALVISQSQEEKGCCTIKNNNNNNILKIKKSKVEGSVGNTSSQPTASSQPGLSLGKAPVLSVPVWHQHTQMNLHFLCWLAL